jgi:hypothetical protein
MSALRLVVPALLLLGSPSWGRAQEAPSGWLARMSLPRWVEDVLGPMLQDGQYSLELRLNPFFQTGDFDGDRQLDAAVFVRDGRTGKEGILLLRRSNAVPTVLGAGKRFGNCGDNFTWLDIWRVEPGRRGDQLYVEKSESASGAISWDGQAYRWTQLGD